MLHALLKSFGTLGARQGGQDQNCNGNDVAQWQAKLCQAPHEIFLIPGKDITLGFSFMLLLGNREQQKVVQKSSGVSSIQIQ